MLRFLLSQLSYRQRFIRACWKRRIYLGPFLSDISSLFPWTAWGLAHDSKLAQLRQSRRRKWDPQNWYFRDGPKLVVVPMPRRSILMLIAHWEATDGIINSYQSYRATSYLPESLRKRIEFEISACPVTKQNQEYLLIDEDNKFIRLDDDQNRIDHRDSPQDATLFNGGTRLDYFLLTHPNLKIFDE